SVNSTRFRVNPSWRGRAGAGRCSNVERFTRNEALPERAMRLPRMTMRRWMSAVVIVGLLGLLVHRLRAFASRAAYHESKMVALDFPPHEEVPGPRDPPLGHHPRAAHPFARQGPEVRLLRPRREGHDEGRGEGRYLARGDGPQVLGGQPLPLVPLRP